MGKELLDLRFSSSIVVNSLPKGIPANERRVWELNLGPSTNTGSQAQLTTPRSLCLTHQNDTLKSNNHDTKILV